MLKYEVMVRNYLWRWKEQAKEAVHDFFTDEEGDTNLISIVIVLVIVIGLAALFRDNIKSMVEAMWTDIGGKMNRATGTNANIETGF